MLLEANLETLRRVILEKKRRRAIYDKCENGPPYSFSEKSAL